MVGVLIITSKGQAASEALSQTPLASGYGELAYTLPEIGSYKMPPLFEAADGEVLNEKAEVTSLHKVFSGKFSLLSFIYSNCTDVNGCPLSSYVFYKLKTAMKNDAQLAEKLQLVSLSFDPERDTPEVMRLYGENFKYAGNKGKWHFLTTKSVQTLMPILEKYNQDIQREKSVNGDASEDISHILRVFLIDPQLRVRNIYSVGFLHSDLLLNDVKTLLLGKTHKKQITTNEAPQLSVAGDSKQGYEKKSYVTNSKALLKRQGEIADLLSIANNPPLGLPRINTPKNNPLTAQKISLGRKLFYDRRLSLNDTISCAMCHIPEQGFTNNEISMAVGVEGRSVRRNSPTIYNIAYASKLFHDGRDSVLEEQVWGPLLAKNEMANPSVGYVINKVKNLADYKGLFEKAFDNESVNMRTLSQALSSYERSLVSADSPFDRWFYGNRKSALDDSAQRGYKLFSAKANCSACHLIQKNFALFSDNQLHNTGVGYKESMGIHNKKEKIMLAPGVFIEVDRSIVDSVGEQSPSDLGLYEVTQNPYDRWKYRTPSLRNVSLTAPYMHNGSLGSLEDVVRFYNKGGITNDLLDPIIKPLGLSDSEVNDLVSFLESLTGSNVNTLVADAFAAPIGDISKNDLNWADKLSEQK